MQPSSINGFISIVAGLRLRTAPQLSSLSWSSGLRSASGSEATAKNHVETSSSSSTSQSTAADPARIASESLRLRYIPRRAVMYVPADDLRKISKIPNLGVDCPVLECEDGVALGKKEEARKNIKEVLQSAVWVKERLQQGRDVAVRVNSLQSGLAEADLQSVLSSSILPTTLLVPKVEDEDDVKFISELLNECLKSRTLSEPLRLLLYIESAYSLMEMRKILKTAMKLENKHENLFYLDGMIFGSDDFCANIGSNRSKEADEVLFARQMFVTVAKSFGRPLQAIDLVHIDYKDTEDLRRQSEQGARWGFTGKQVIHPSQVPIVQQAFSPSSEKVAWAKDLCQHFAEHQKLGKGAFSFRNSMIDMPLLLQAQNILEQQARLQSSEENSS